MCEVTSCEIRPAQKMYTLYKYISYYGINDFVKYFNASLIRVGTYVYIYTC